jgi:hypothetical protein
LLACGGYVYAESQDKLHKDQWMGLDLYPIPWSLC